MIYAIKDKTTREDHGYPIYPAKVKYVIGERDPEVNIGDCPTWDYNIMTLDNLALLDVYTQTDSFLLTDMEFYDDNNIFVTCNTKNIGEQHWKAHVLRVNFNGSKWVWSNEHGPEDQRFTAIKRIPGSSRFLVAAEQSGGGVQGGIRCFDAENTQVWEPWLQGGSICNRTPYLPSKATPRFTHPLLLTS